MMRTAFICLSSFVFTRTDYRLNSRIHSLRGGAYGIGYMVELIFPEIRFSTRRLLNLFNSYSKQIYPKMKHEILGQLLEMPDENIVVPNLNLFCITEPIELLI